jgi:ribonuclease HI
MNANACGPSSAWVVHCDGSAVPNPGRMGLGAVVAGPDGQRHTLSHLSTEHGCNNEAELLALMAALRIAQQQGATSVHIYSDSTIVVEQLGTAGVMPIERLADLFDEARVLIGSFETVDLQWLPRHRNSDADALARAALGLLPKPPPKWKKRRR